MNQQVKTPKAVWAILFFLFVLSAFFACCSVNLINENKRLKKQLENPLSIEEEVKNIYTILEAQSSHIRTIMNMSIRNNHYDSHTTNEDGLACPECIKIYEEVVRTTPEMPGVNGAYFKEFYVDRLKEAKRNAN